ncbi:hypothetical protein FQ330_07575 [Agrococcus sediminis]|uniref:Leucine-rich repeat domain-containing protein n=1 Tax=Agrococcus sediminis TaxID=2599924 RepID=A0A5M8QA20_9MICO|nr:hypothetical protein [Agrococcus sediminis]KAA6432827.1 hypothetical protein FQ330_07575 [Agrococcus sediminis]
MQDPLIDGIAIDLTQGRAAIRSDDFESPGEVEALTLFVNRRSDLSGLPNLPRLRSLEISGTPRRLPEMSYAALEYYDGPIFGGALASRALRYYYCLEGRTALSSAHVFAGPVEVIRVNGNGGEASMPQLSQPSTFRSLDVSRFSSFDLQGISKAVHLERVHLGLIDTVRSAEELGALRELESISLERVTVIEPIDSVHGWNAESAISVIDRHPFPPDLRHQLSAGNAPWAFPPAPSLFVEPPVVPSTVNRSLA